jgi:hypothetical protein
MRVIDIAMSFSSGGARSARERHPLHARPNHFGVVRLSNAPKRTEPTVLLEI